MSNLYVKKLKQALAIAKKADDGEAIVHLKIAIAASRNTGLRLDAQEVHDLFAVHAVAYAAENIAEELLNLDEELCEE